jgi:Leucine-rich repeat (LRR) protein
MRPRLSFLLSQTERRAGALLAAVPAGPPLRAWAWALACASVSGCLVSAGPIPEPAAISPPVFIEALPRLTTEELFGALRELGVEVSIATDRRLVVRMNDARSFVSACELLTLLDHDLEQLDLAYLAIDDLDPLAPLRNTERLDLTGTRADLRPLQHLIRLRSLSLANTDLDSLAPLAKVESLEHLDLSDARVNLTAIGQLTSLRELDLRAARTAPRGFEVRDGEGLELADLRSSTTLERLDLSQTKVRDWWSLGSLWTVRELDLSFTNFVELRLLERFDELEVLLLRRTAVADIRTLARLDSLRVVDLRDCDLVDDADVDQLALLRPDLAIYR